MRNTRELNRPSPQPMPGQMLGPRSSPQYAHFATTIAGLHLPGSSRAVTPVSGSFVPTSHDMVWRRGGGMPATATYPAFMSSDALRLSTPLVFPPIFGTSGSGDWGGSTGRSTARPRKPVSIDPLELQKLAHRPRPKSLDTQREFSMARTRAFFPKRMHHSTKSIAACQDRAEVETQMNEIVKFVLKIDQKETKQFAARLMDANLTFCD